MKTFPYSPPRVYVCETPRCFLFVAVVDDLRENRS